MQTISFGLTQHRIIYYVGNSVLQISLKEALENLLMITSQPHKAMQFVLTCKLGLNRQQLFFMQQTLSNASELWRPSPCTIGFSGRTTFFERTERFKLFSIYAKDDVNKKKKIFSDLEKPELLVVQFRREIGEANLHSKRKKLYPSRGRSLTAASKYNMSEKSQSKQSLAQTVTKRLYHHSPKLELKHDYYGNRSHFVQQPEELFITKNISEFSIPLKKTTDFVSKNPYIFTRSRRLDLSKPRNFFPGPGTYPPYHYPLPKLETNKTQGEISLQSNRLETH